ncbi:MAG TPA: transporter substrate-binding domain-containing protein [Patescibacteria group bacterium]|nr:transporter substrate-binding domain-containing protein [Patescibacteria group bacterium]
MRSRAIIILSIAGLVILSLLMALLRKQDGIEPILRDLEAIKQRDTLTVLTTYSSTSYFLYRGAPLGYEYELLRTFAQEKGLELRTVVVRNQDSLFHMLNRGDGDVVAARLMPSDETARRVKFTKSLYETNPVLVQRSGPLDTAKLGRGVDSLLDPAGNADAYTDSTVIRAKLITKPSELGGEKIHVPKGPVYKNMLVELSDKITGDIQVVEVPGDVSSESLIQRVAKGEIQLTVAPENLAKLNQGYYTNIVIYPQVGPSNKVVWAVRRNSPKLLDTLNAWITEKQSTQTFTNLYNKYFVDNRAYQDRIASNYLAGSTSSISKYDHLLKQYSVSIGWDWRLLAAQTYQESKFIPNARSWAGAAGLLQLMPPTAREFGVRNANDPEDNVRGATKFIKWLTNYWDDKIIDPNERMKFILASYNTGHGHVEDARRLVVKYGGDQNKWEDVAYWLLQKSKAQYYNDPVVKYGYCRGLEPVQYVSKILDRWEHYKQLVVA